MSKVMVAVQGEVKVWPEGIGEDPIIAVDSVVELQTGGVQAEVKGLDLGDLQEFLEKMWDRDTGAPSVGSASGFRTGKKDAKITVVGAEGLAVLRVYNQKASELNEEVSAGQYVTYKGERTDELWELVYLLPGQSLELQVIESNAVTISLYA